MPRVYYYGSLREMTGKKDEELDVPDVKNCLNTVRQLYGKEAYKEAKRSLITLNGVSILSIDNFKTKTKPEDEVRFLPICGGG